MEVADLTELIIIISLSLLIFITVLVIVFLKPILKLLRKYIFSRCNFLKHVKLEEDNSLQIGEIHISKD